MRRSISFGCVLLAGLLLPAGSASALIQIDRGIAGARLGAKRADVRAALGKPSKTTSGKNFFGRYVIYRYAGGIRVTFQGRRRVTAVETTGLGDRTSRGIGVGSTEAAVKARVRGVKCQTFASLRTCHTHELLPGQRITDFRIVSGKVDSVLVGIVID